jgi:hypothetical protein
MKYTSSRRGFWIKMSAKVRVWTIDQSHVLLYQFWVGIGAKCWVSVEINEESSYANEVVSTMRSVSKRGALQLKVHGQFRPDPDNNDMSGTTRILSTLVSYFRWDLLRIWVDLMSFVSEILSSYFSLLSQKLSDSILRLRSNYEPRMRLEVDLWNTHFT